MIEGFAPFADGFGPFFSGILQSQIEQLGGGFLRGKEASGFDDLAQGAVERLDGIGGVDDSADIFGKSKKGRQMGPVFSPGLADGGEIRVCKLVCVSGNQSVF